MSHNLKMTCVKLSPEVRAAVDGYCNEHGLQLSEFLRGLINMWFEGQISPGSIEGYIQAKATAIRLAEILIAEAARALPQTLDEANARYALTG